MVFSNSTTKAGVVEEIDFLVNTDDNTYPIAEKTRNINRALDRVVSMILSVDGKWQFDDTNSSDLPIARADINASQYDYTFDAEHLKVLRLEIQDDSGNWRVIPQRDIRDIKEGLLDASSPASQPAFYDVSGTQIFLYPATNYSKTDGLRVHFQRVVNYFTTTDTTKQPGFAKNFHRLMSLWGAYDYCVSKRLDQGGLLRQEINTMESELKDFYSKRDAAVQPVLKVKVNSSR